MATTASSTPTPPANPPGIELRAVSKRYGLAADAPLVVRSVDLIVPKGSLTTILGPSGCGKTTILRMIAGLEAPSAGQILIEGRDVTTLGPAERNLSMMFQSYALFPHMSVVENVAYGLRMSGIKAHTARERAIESLRNVGLVGLEGRAPAELSGGQQQRVALARALVLEPAVLLFDEPLSNLDARLRREMREEIRGLQQRLGLTVAYVTHDQSEALAVSDHIVVMNVGVIAQQGTPEELYEFPASTFVAGFMGEARLFEGAADAGGTVSLGPLRISARRPVPAGPVTIAVRPEAWRIDAADDANHDPSPSLPARLMRMAYLGNTLEYCFETALGEVLVVSGDLAGRLAAGAAVRLRLAEHGVAVVAAR